MLAAALLLSWLALGCSSLITLTGGYARPLSERGPMGGPAVHAALGMGSGARGSGAGLGPHVRYKQTDYASELALGPHLYLLAMDVDGTVGPFTRTGELGLYGRFGLNLVEFERYEGRPHTSSLGPSLDVGVLLPFALTLTTSIEHDVRFSDRSDETFVLILAGFGLGGVGPF